MTSTPIEDVTKRIDEIPLLPEGFGKVKEELKMIWRIIIYKEAKK